jgi:hypothetical protein
MPGNGVTLKPNPTDTPDIEQLNSSISFKKRRHKMNNFRKLAISAGILFIIYDFVDILSFLFLGPLTASNYLVSVSENASLVGTGAFLLLIGGACASGIAISLYPVLKKFNPVLALGAVGFRISEGVLRFVSVSFLLLIITLSRITKPWANCYSQERSGWAMLGRCWLFP